MFCEAPVRSKHAHPFSPRGRSDMTGREGLGKVGRGGRASSSFPAVCRLSSISRTFEDTCNFHQIDSTGWLSNVSGFLRDNLAIVQHFRNLDPFRTAMPHRVLANVKIVDIQKRKVPSKHYVSIQV